MIKGSLLVGDISLSEKEIKIINAFYRVDKKYRKKHTFLLEFDGEKRHFLATNQCLLFVSSSEDKSPEKKRLIQIEKDSITAIDITDNKDYWGINTFAIGERYNKKETEINYGFNPQFIELISHCFTILGEDPVEVALTWLGSSSKKCDVHPVLSFRGKSSWAILMKKRKI